ncbi:hypothetical protein LCGC14_0243900 [marine sediment metagenome]|uniref:Uncharacterized protein n=1 Tax=marine sediment metagenome TaxID=412755 RepID=A0A0F9XB03_9ZZZZ
MSCNNWEEGSVKFSMSEWVAFRTAIIEKVNELREKKYRLACEAYAAAQKAGKGQRGFSRADWVQDSERFWEAAQYITRRGDKKIYKPKKKAFPILPTSKSVVLHLEEVTITLDNKKRAMTYSSGENNRAVERARENPVVALLFQRLRAITWTRGTGGEFVGNDEHNRDSRDSGGGGNYTTACFGVQRSGNVILY